MFRFLLYAAITLIYIDTSEAVPPSHPKFGRRCPQLGASIAIIDDRALSCPQDVIAVSDTATVSDVSQYYQSIAGRTEQDVTNDARLHAEQALIAIRERDDHQNLVHPRALDNILPEDSMTFTIAFVTDLSGTLLTVSRTRIVTDVTYSMDHPFAYIEQTSIPAIASSITDTTGTNSPEGTVAPTVISVIEREKREPLQGGPSLTPATTSAQSSEQLQATPLISYLIETSQYPSGYPHDMDAVSTALPARERRMQFDGITSTTRDHSGTKTVYLAASSSGIMRRDQGAAPLSPITTTTRLLWDGGYEVVTLCRRDYGEGVFHHQLEDRGSFDPRSMPKRQMIPPFRISSFLDFSHIKTGSTPTQTQTSTPTSSSTSVPSPVPRQALRLNTSTSIVCSESTWAVLLVFVIIFPVGFTVLMTEVFIRHIWFRGIPEDVKTRLLADTKYRSYLRMGAIGAVSLVCVLLGILVACFLRNGVCEDLRTFQRPES
ncbi:hypothetical protein ABW21_db0207918 [Orbilia brochopaga]|nr:hypothetical protein ABW21_db0207918 [Drechslerella brochopaga]